MTIAAVMLCAGKGTRMNDDSKNKVCFDCAGVPVIKRIIGNMRQAGISRFVLVVGHRAESVMDCLADEPGVIYAYQKEQKGTGHAARCGLEALAQLGFKGRAIVSMGDKIVAANVIHDLMEASTEAEAVWGVQPVAVNHGGGRVVVADGQPYGVVEWADVAYYSLAGHPVQEWQGILDAMKLNAKKAAKVMERATSKPPVDGVTLNGRHFSSAELRAVQYANAGLYCFDVTAALEAIGQCGSDNAQGEIYLTDTLEIFASRKAAKLLEIERQEDMLTFSTRPELRDMSRYFLPKVETCLAALRNGEWTGRFEDIYGAAASGQKERYVQLLEAFLKRHGNRRIMIVRAPGRVNLMGRHIDHRGGNANVMTIDKDTVVVASPREDDSVTAANIDGVYPDTEFSISQCLALGGNAPDWLSYLEAAPVKADLAAHCGHWVNYIKSAVLRFQMAMDIPLCGMDMLMTGNIPVAAGLSSSSSVVVATAELVTGLNCLNITTRSFIDLCGEGEWFVGSRGGASDHAAMKCGQRNYIRQLQFKPFAVGRSFPFSDKYAIVVADSCQKARKSGDSKDIFNARVAAYECAFMLLRKAYPQYGWREFRELADVAPETEIYKMLKLLPLSATREELSRLLPLQTAALKKIFSTHNDPGTYELRGVALYGISECKRASMLGEFLEKKDYAAVGEMMNISHDGDRLMGQDCSDQALDALAAAKAPVWRQYGAYRCSTARIDEMCDLLKGMPGVLGCSLAGAGLGGSVIAIVDATAASQVIYKLNSEFYDKYGLPHCAGSYRPSVGSRIVSK